MRIIGGSLRGRQLASPPGMETRPMLDRVREALFSTLLHWTDGARVLDLFAGTGGLGLEALSRGADSARCVEKHEPTLERLRRNVSDFGLEDEVEVVAGDALDRRNWGEPADIVFFDPPYPSLATPSSRRRVLYALEQLVVHGLAEDGVLVFHAPADEIQREELPRDRRVRERRYGSSSLWFVQAAPEDEEVPGAAR
jgi:16S rRNA (guanine966-N2)-methyltransferase